MASGFFILTILFSVLSVTFAGQWTLDTTTAAAILAGVGTAVSFFAFTKLIWLVNFPG